MTIALLLTKDDIETTAIGTHYQVKTTDGVVINFTPEAIDELIADIKALRELEAAEQGKRQANPPPSVPVSPNEAITTGI